MAKANSSERIAPSQITQSNLHYINLQFGGQRGEHSARQSKKAPVDITGAKLCRLKPSVNRRAQDSWTRARSVSPTDWLTA
jgi:hypothetical protein